MMWRLRVGQALIHKLGEEFVLLAQKNGAKVQALSAKTKASIEDYQGCWIQHQRPFRAAVSQRIQIKKTDIGCLVVYKLDWSDLQESV